MKMKSLALICALLLNMTGLTALAQTELPQPVGFASLLLGYSKPHDLDGRLGYGAEIGLRMPNRVTAFGYFLASAAKQNNVDANVSHYGVGGDYKFDQLMGLRIGARLGMVNESTYSSRFSFGPHVAWEYDLAPNLSLGVEPILMIDTGTRSGSTLYVLGTGKFLF